MNYTVRQLEIFLKVVEQKSITKASELLFLTQPAVSIQLKKFQEEFDIPLIEVLNRSVHITDFGYEVAEVTRRILNEINELDGKTLAYKGLITGKLKIMSVSTGKYIIPYLLADFLKQHPGIELQLDVTNKNEVVRSLERNEPDFALISVAPENLSLFAEELMDNKLYLVGGKAHPLKKRGNTPELFNEIPLIYRESGSGTRTAMEQYLRGLGLPTRVKLELTSNEAVKQAVIAGLGLSVMPEIGIKDDLKSGELVIVPVKGLPIVTKWQLAWLAGKKMSPAAAAYLEFIRTNKQQILGERFQ
jgi:DNA-binding transcriptional LysR family regulator